MSCMKIPSFCYSPILESIEQFLNSFANQPNETDMNDLESNNESVDRPLVSHFPYSDNDSDDSEVLNELSGYENAGVLSSGSKQQHTQRNEEDALDITDTYLLSGILLRLDRHSSRYSVALVLE
ncbi:hypothetical protein Tco_0368910 [Tanacetum coccineum]